jgi:hypothetical protein
MVPAHHLFILWELNRSKQLYADQAAVHNPIVFACFQGAQTRHRKPRILFYG